MNLWTELFIFSRSKPCTVCRWVMKFLLRHKNYFYGFFFWQKSMFFDQNFKQCRRGVCRLVSIALINYFIYCRRAFHSWENTRNVLHKKKGIPAPSQKAKEWRKASCSTFCVFYGDKWLNTMTKLGLRSYHQQDDKLDIERKI